MLKVGTKVRLNKVFRSDGLQPEGVVVSNDGALIRVSWEDRKGTEQCNGLYSQNSLEVIPDSRRPHYDLIIAWANGETIQRQASDGSWWVQSNPSWETKNIYRVKSEKQDKLDSLRRERNKLDTQIKELEAEM